MQALFHEVNTLDQACYNNYNLSPDLLMEHAANSIAQYILKNFPLYSKLMIITGSGHNGADGLALARLLAHDYDVNVYEYKEQKSELGLLQKERASLVGVHFLDTVPCDATVAVDAMFGTGLSRVLDSDAVELIKEINMLSGFKIAVDIPSGVLNDGRCSEAVFRADKTITMGALKVALYADAAKDFTGKISVANLGVSRALYESDSDMFLL